MNSRYAIAACSFLLMSASALLWAAPAQAVKPKQAEKPTPKAQEKAETKKEANKESNKQSGKEPAGQEADKAKVAGSLREPEVMSPFGRPLFARSESEDIAKLEAQLAAARKDMASHPDDPTKLVWVGRRLGYLWRMREAIDVYTQGIAKWPDFAPLYRHRGHRYISIRAFDKAIDDLMHASRLIHGKPDEIELDGMPNAKNIPLTTTGFNVFYHLGVAYYATGELNESVLAFRQAMAHAHGKPDNLVACLDWAYLGHQTLGERAKAERLLGTVSAELEIIENHAYHRRLLLYKGELKPEQVLDPSADPLQTATSGYGVAKWYLLQGEAEKGKALLRKLINSDYWPAFGVIAAEVEWSRLGSAAGKP